MQGRQGTPLQQAVHGLTGARRRRVCCRPGRSRRQNNCRRQAQEIKHFIRELGRCGCAGRRCGRRPFGRQCVQALPPAVGGAAVGLNGRHHQGFPRSGERHIQGVEFFTLTGDFFGLQRLNATCRRITFTDQKHKALRHCSFARPIQQHSHALGIARRGVRVQQQHRLGLQTLGAMNGQEPHRVCTDSGRRQNTTGPERPHQGIGRGVTPAVDLQRNRQQRT